MKMLRRLFGQATDAGPREPAPPPRPDRLTYAVGDIHGRLDLLHALDAEILADAAGRPHDLVYLGDYIDRGPESAAVLRHLHARETADPSDEAAARVTCLMGNHDLMMLRFLTDPEDGVNWLLVGGRDTVTSFGIPEVRLAGSEGGSIADRVAAQAASLAEALGTELTEWVAARPLWWRSGDLVAVHALTNPTRPMEEQDDKVLLWARPGKDLAPREDGAWVVHGHTIVAEPTIRARHVNVDTGAFQGGPLTAAVFLPGEDVRFLQADG